MHSDPCVSSIWNRDGLDWARRIPKNLGIDKVERIGGTANSNACRMMCPVNHSIRRVMRWRSQKKIFSTLNVPVASSEIPEITFMLLSVEAFHIPGIVSPQHELHSCIEKQRCNFDKSFQEAVHFVLVD